MNPRNQLLVKSMFSVCSQDFKILFTILNVRHRPSLAAAARYNAKQSSISLFIRRGRPISLNALNCSSSRGVKHRSSVVRSFIESFPRLCTNSWTRLFRVLFEMKLFLISRIASRIDLPSLITKYMAWAISWALARFLGDVRLGLLGPAFRLVPLVLLVPRGATSPAKERQSTTALVEAEGASASSGGTAVEGASSWLISLAAGDSLPWQRRSARW